MKPLPLSSFLASILLSAGALAQEGLPVSLDPTQYGAAVSSSGDVDLDGYTDVIVGAYWTEGKKTHGSATVFSGKTGEVLYTVHGEEEGALFGLSVAGAGDVDDDGTADFLVGAPFESVKDERVGVVRVYSGRSGKVLHEVSGEEPGERFGWSVNSAGDVDQDGFSDFVVGAPRGAPKKKTELKTGKVVVYSGKKGKILYEWFGLGHGDDFGHSVDSAGDADGDGSDEVVVGAWVGGYVQVYSGRKGELLGEFRDEEEESRFGWCVRRAGDVDQSGVSEIVVGIPWGEKVGAQVIAPKKGEIQLSPERNLSPDAEGWGYGLAVDGAGDINADGFADILVGDPGFPRLFGPDGRPLAPRFRIVRDPVARPGRAYVLSGQDGEVLLELEGDDKDDCFGVSVASAGDANADGFGDVVIGAGPHAGYHARIYSGHKGEVLQTLKIEP